jgi:hypothetical protein
MARILGPDNINKLTGNNVYYFILNSSDKDEMARILGKNNINKLSSQHKTILRREGIKLD